MGFFRRIFGAKKSHNSSAPKERRSRWSFTKSPNTKTVPPASLSNKPDVSLTPYDANLDPNKHAIAVAAATAAVAEAALAAAHAAAEVVRLTNSGGGGGSASENHVSQRRWWVAAQVAAVKIQSAFRGYLARRALRALKALVKLQALVRGHIVRKQTADMLRRMQALVKVQARARASRAHLSESLHFSGKSALSRSTFVASPNKSEYQLRTHSSKFDGPSIFKRCGSSSTYRDIADLDKAPASSNWLDHWMAENMWNNETVSKNGNSDNENSDKILEVDTWKPHSNHHQHHILASDCYYNHKFTNSPSKFSTKSKNSIPCVSSNEVLSLSKLKFGTGDANAFTSAGNSPQVFPASYRPGGSGRRGPCTPTRSECNWSALSGYSGYPNYMANTESSRAKVRSQSAPRQRLDFDRYGSTRRYGQGIWEWGNVSYSERDFGQDIVSSRNKGFPVSERLSRVGSSKLR